LRRSYSRGPIPRPEIQRKHKINDEIQGSELRVIDSTGEQLGVIPRKKALDVARERGLDLVLIAPQAKPPVCKIIDYGKFAYEQQKREKAQKKAQQQQELKEIRLRAGTDTHDLEFKMRHSREFLEKGHKVKATVMFRGREIVHKDLGAELLQKFIDGLADISKIDQAMKSEGRFLSVTLAPDATKMKAIKKAEKAEKAEKQGKPARSARASKAAKAESEDVANEMDPSEDTESTETTETTAGE
jgi:translation initiation factor IF-3